MTLKRKQTKLKKSNNEPSFQLRDGSRPKRAYECKNCDSSEKTNQGSFQTRDEKMNFLGQRYPPQVTSRVWENQVHQYQHPFPGPENIRKETMRDLLTNMEKLFHQAKSIMQ